MRRFVKIPTPSPRFRRISSFEALAESILEDISEAHRNQVSAPGQVVAILPLLRDIRRHGERLVLGQKFYHRVLFPRRELQLENRVVRLYQMENRLMSKKDDLS